jgi:hypothetical protein
MAYQELGMVELREIVRRWQGGAGFRAIVVTRADRYTPGLNRVFLEYAQHRGFIVDAALPGHPRGKPRAERGIPRDDFFRGETFHDLADMQTRAVLSNAATSPAPASRARTVSGPRIVFERLE